MNSRAEAEAAMPPTTDEASVQLRLVLLERLESSEFAAREADIDSFQVHKTGSCNRGKQRVITQTECLLFEED